MEYSVAGFSVTVGPGQNDATHSDGTPGLAWSGIVKSPDGLAAEVLVKDFGDIGREVKLANFLASPPPVYDHLDRNGAMTVQVLENGDWVAPVRALRPGGKSWPTLNHVTIEELGALLGDSAETWLTGFGFKVGTWAELNPLAKKFKDSVAVAIPADKAYLLLLPWALTRPVALMKKLGYDQAIV